MSLNEVKKRRSFVPALFLILVGLIFLLPTLHLLKWSNVWPLLLVVVGLLFFFSAFGAYDKGAVFPGTILIFLGAFFFVWMHYNLRWNIDEVLPVFPLIVGLAFFVLFVFNPRDWGVLIPAAILVFISSVFFADNFDIFPWSAWEVIGKTWPAVLILIGVLILIRHAIRKS